MAQNLQLDPVAQDYVVIAGSSIPSTSIDEPAYYSLKIPAGNWLYANVGQGSKMYTLQNVKRTSTIEQQFAAIANKAIQDQLIATGLATGVGVSNISLSNTGSSNQIAVVPAATPIESQFVFTPV